MNKDDEAQILRDAGIRVKPGWFGPRVEFIDRQTAAAQAADDGSDIDPDTFPGERDGHGAYGKWTLDANGLPAYTYELNQLTDRTAFFMNSQGRDRRDHWHQIGNDHITGLVSNDGVVQVYLADRGGVFLNRYEPGTEHLPTLMGTFDRMAALFFKIVAYLKAIYYRWQTRDKIVPRGVNPLAQPVQEHLDFDSEFACAGGYSYLNDGTETWATALRYAPAGAHTRRVFGTGYFETETIYRTIRHTRRVYAPAGDHPVMLSDVEIQNTGSTPVTLRHYEYWDVNMHQMRVQWIRSGVFGSSGDVARALLNSRFQPRVQSEMDGQALRFTQQRFASPPLMDDELGGFVDSTPPEVFLANLSGENLPAADQFYDKRAFFGSGNALTPDAVRNHLPGKTDHARPDDSMPYCLVLEHELTLAPGDTKKLRFAYGALVRPDQSMAFLTPYSAEIDTLAQTMQAWRKQLPYFSNGRSPVLQWEMNWHAASMLASTLYSEFYKTHYIPQGSAYLYLHGADGAPRDQALFTLPLVYIRPSLARELLILLMRLRNAETLALPYSFVGNGAQDNALGLHSRPSVSIFFLLALSEYLSATGNRAFLHERYPLYKPGSPPTPGPELTVLGHIQAAFNHLEAVGLGPNNLLVIGSGDWDDAIVATRSFRPTFDRERTLREGESVPNSQMALYVLPLIASLIAAEDAALADKMRALAETLKTALTKQWLADKKWFYRAWVFDRLRGNDPIGNNSLSLQAQVWALISGLAADMHIEPELIETVSKQLDDDSPTGAMLEPDGQVWPAVSQLLTWGYQRSRPDLAWRSLNRHTFAVHANVFPSIWFNIWTGPDGTNSYKMANPGGTWASPVTPMTDLPGMNANQDSMALLGLLRCCGIEPSRAGTGIEITPKAPLDRYVLKTELITLRVMPGRIAGEYRAANDGATTLNLVIPGYSNAMTATLNGEPVVPAATGRVAFALQFTQGQSIPFELVWS